MKQPIMQDDKKCLVCGTRIGLHLHHVYGGPNRKISDAHGFTCWLCGKHHNLSNDGVHFNPELDSMIKKQCQRIYEKDHSRDEFMQLIGRNFL